MQWVVLGFGVAVIAVAHVDVLLTVVGVGSAAGPLAGRFTSGVWALAGVLRRAGRHRLLALSGVASIVVVVALWLLLLWIGWTAVFAADASAVRDTASGQPAGFGDRVYFAGYSLFTLGNGDFRPHGLPWQLATVLSTASGLIVATLAITYILGIVSAATQKRETALVIWTMGRTPQDILTRAWNGSDLGRLDDQVRSIVPALAGLAERHLAYPMLHQFHAADPRSAIAPNIARLDEALTLARHGLRDGHGVQEATITQVHEVVDAYLATLSVADAPRRPPGPPALAPLADAGLPTAGTGAVQAGAAEIAERRGRLRAAVVQTGWSWADVDGRRNG